MPPFPKIIPTFNYRALLKLFRLRTSRVKMLTEAQRQAMTQSRTIFLKDESPHFENLSLLPDMWWTSVQLSPADSAASDVELMDIVIEHLRAGRYDITHISAAQHLEPFYVSVPVMNTDSEYRHGWYSVAIGLVEHYQREIEAGRLAVDRDYLFGGREGC